SSARARAPAARTISPPGCSSAGTRAAPTPPCCTPRSPRRATRAASDRCGATCSLCAPRLPLRRSRCPRPPSGEVTRWITSHPGHLTEDETAKLAKIKARSPQLNATAGHVTAFAEMMPGRHHERLPAWITAVERDDLPCLHAFTCGHPSRPARRRQRAPPRLQQRHRRGHHLPRQSPQTPDVRPRQPRPPAKENPAQHIGTTYSHQFTIFLPEPVLNVR